MRFVRWSFRSHLAVTSMLIVKRFCAQDTQKAKKIRVKEILVVPWSARKFFFSFLNCFYSQLNCFYSQFYVFSDPNTTSRWILFGIVSFGNGCARAGELGSYTSVTYYLNRITEILGLLLLYSTQLCK